MEERQIPDFFKCHKNYSDKWNKAAFNSVSEWMVKKLNKCGIGATQTVKEWALDSRDCDKITGKRNCYGVRFILCILYQKGYVDFIDNLHFCLKKRIESTFLSLWKKC